MTVRKRYSGKKFTWEFCVDIPSNEYDSNGNIKRKQKRKSGFATEKEAKKAEREFLNELEDGNIIICPDSTFKQLADAFIKEIEASPEYEKGTVSNYKGYFKNHMQMLYNIKAKSLNEDVLNNWVRHLQEKGASPHVINGCRKFGMSVFTYHRKKFKFNPFKEIDKIKEPKILRNRLTIEALKNMAIVCKKKLPDFYCIFSLAYLVGMRLGEYSAVCVEKIKQDRNEIYIDQQYTRRELKPRTKTYNSTRIARYPDELNEVINWHRRKYNVFSGFMFKGKNNKPVSPNWINERFKTLLELCGYPRNYMRVHDLRGEYVDIMNSAGVPVPFISRNIGHARTSTTNDIYTSILNSVKDEAMVKLSKKVF